MLGLKLHLEGMYFTSFRKPTSTSLILTYPLPPYTTIRGILSNALGLKRDDMTVQDWFRIGIRPINNNDKSREMAKILKLISREIKIKCRNCGNKWIVTTKPKKCPECESNDVLQIPNYKQKFPSAPMFREFLINPRYEVFLAGGEDKIKNVHSATLNPTRPLYFGASDDLIDVGVGEPVEVEKITTKEVSSVVEGIHENCAVEKIPYKFHKVKRDFSVEYKTVSIPRDGIVRSGESIECVKFGDEVVWVG